MDIQQLLNDQGFLILNDINLFDRILEKINLFSNFISPKLLKNLLVQTLRNNWTRESLILSTQNCHQKRSVRKYLRNGPAQDPPGSLRPQLSCAMHPWRHRSWLRREWSRTEKTEAVPMLWKLEESQASKAMPTPLISPAMNSILQSAIEVVSPKMWPKLNQWPIGPVQQ